jgi:hypothetical protein
VGLSDLLREGAMDLLGISEEVDALRESSAAGQLLARKVEDMDFGNLYGSGGQAGSYFDPERGVQVQQTLRSYKYFFGDPMIKRSVMLRALYTWGRGMAPPKYKPDPDAPTSEAKAGAWYIARFWKDPENQEALTSTKKMLQRDIESNLQGNVFFLLFRGDEKAPTTDDMIPVGSRGQLPPATLKMSTLPDVQMVDVIPHPGNADIPVFYKRQFREREYVFSALQGEGQWIEGDIVTLYYRDWRHEAPALWGRDKRNRPCPPTSPRCVKTEPWGPPADQIAAGRVYHVYENKIGKMRFGITDLQPVLKWAKGLNEFMTSRLAMVQAITQLAMRLKAKGGPKSVSQVGAQLMDLQRLAGAMDGTTENLSRAVAQSGRTKATVESQGVDLQPMVQDTNGANAQADASIFKGQIATGTGIGLHLLGDPNGSNLATATSVDGPMLKGQQWNQERWKTTILDITGYMLEGVGLDPSRLTVDMPPILERDVANITEYLSAASTVVDPQAANTGWMRFVVHEILDAMGKPNADEIVDELFPRDMVTPFEQAVQLAQAAPPGQGVGQDTRGPALAGANDKQTKSQRGATDAKQAAAAAEQRANQGRHRGPNAPGGPTAASRTARDRSHRRWALAVEAGEITLDEVPSDLREAVAADVDSVEVLARALEGDFPRDLQEAADAALAEFDEACPGILSAAG